MNDRVNDATTPHLVVIPVHADGAIIAEEHPGQGVLVHVPVVEIEARRELWPLGILRNPPRPIQ